MSATVKQAQIGLQFNVTENTGGGPSGVEIDSTYQGLNQFLNLISGSSTPNPQLFSVYATAIAAGNYNIDLTAAQGSNGNVNATGMKLLAIVVANPSGSTSSVVVATGGTNGYTIDTLTVRQGGFGCLYCSTQNIAVDGTHKQINVAMTGNGTPLVGLLFG